MGRYLRQLLKKLVLSVFILAVVLGGLDFQVEKTEGATQGSAVTVNLAVNATLSNSCGSPVTMGAITGTGQSTLTTNSITCTVITNNSGGYSLVWEASAVTMSNSYSDTIAAYTPETPNVPETWSVAGSASEWGGQWDQLQLQSIRLLGARLILMLAVNG